MQKRKYFLDCILPSSDKVGTQKGIANYIPKSIDTVSRHMITYKLCHTGPLYIK